MRPGLVYFLLALVSCSSSDDTPKQTTPEVDGSKPDAAIVDAGADVADARPDVLPDGPRPVAGTLRIMAANITSGPSLSYDAPESIRIFQGMHPDIVLIQELKVGGNTAPEVAAFVASTFGATFTYYREQAAGFDIPNGVISRYPIMESGTWADPQVANRGFAYAKIAIPGPHPLWAVSMHLLTTSAGQRAAEAAALVTQVNGVVPPADYLVLGGDFNTAVRTEACLTTLSEIVVTAAPYPKDGLGNGNTSAARSKPHDWLLADQDLGAWSVPVVIGQRSYEAGLVFDSRVYTPLADVAPVLATDSAAQNMQHMPVIRDFRVPE